VSSHIDRRTLLKVSALGGAAVALGGSATGIAVADDADVPLYLTDVRAPVPDEIHVENLHVEGRIPAELNGRYLRDGPNPGKDFDSGVWWSNAGMIHGVRLRGGRAEWYRNRWVRSMNTPDLRNSAANTRIIQHAGKILALYEVAYPYEITRELDTVGPVDYGGKLQTAMTAHPKEDLATGELHFFAYSFRGRPYLTYQRLSKDGRLVRTVPIDLPEPVMMHDFAITENYVIWLDLPTVWDAESMQTGFPSWGANHVPRIGIMPKDGVSADVRWFTVSPRYSWHVGNAYEDGRGRVVLEAISGTEEGWRSTTSYFLGKPAGRAMGSLWRWTFDPRRGTVGEEPVDDNYTEFPSINESRTGRSHRYVYSPTSPLSVERHNRIVKHDTVTGRTVAHYLGRDLVAGEAVFVPARGARCEDDGWLMTIVHDLVRDASSLQILDATAPARPPVATVHLPRRVPYGFHGAWLSDPT
jgi:carotenoid cleavage dioxygenase-like enzyme